MSPGALFAIATAIWGSTWLAIKFQLGTVDPAASVAYRFALAAAMLGAWCVASGRSLALPRRAHAWFLVQGATFFGLNYIGVYLAERHVTSGLVAVVFSTIVFMTPLGTRIAFGAPIRAATLVGAVLGVAGVALLFVKELRAASHGGEAALGIGYAFGATAIAALGNLASMRIQRDGWPLLSSTAWGMGYGAVVSALAATIAGVHWSFDPRPAYVLSLVYLAALGSVVAFAAYLALLRKAGAVTASFVGVSTPVVAMLMSTLFEGYRWTWVALAGVALAVAGNVIALRTRPARALESPRAPAR
jgi:drug/metabolite transporter (DMT)-like permease